MPDWKDTLEKLEEKLTRAVELFKQAQAERRALREEIEKLKGASRDHTRRDDALERAVKQLRREREDVRARIEKLIAQIDALTRDESAG